MTGRFIRSESGAMSADWVVLSAGVVALAIVVAMSVSVPAINKAARTGDTLRSESPLNQ